MSNSHRKAVGGMWERIGHLQLAWALRLGMTNADKLLELGCGSLRAGRLFIRMLEAGNYTGVDKDKSLLEAGWNHEVPADVRRKGAELVHSDIATLRLDRQFDWIWSCSVITHMGWRGVSNYFETARHHIKPGGIICTSFFDANRPAKDRVVSTSKNSDPFEISVGSLKELAVGFVLDNVYDWDHPRRQSLAVFRPE